MRAVQTFPHEGKNLTMREVLALPRSRRIKDQLVKQRLYSGGLTVQEAITQPPMSLRDRALKVKNSGRAFAWD